MCKHVVNTRGATVFVSSGIWRKSTAYLYNRWLIVERLYELIPNHQSFVNRLEGIYHLLLSNRLP